MMMMMIFAEVFEIATVQLVVNVSGGSFSADTPPPLSILPKGGEQREIKGRNQSRDERRHHFGVPARVQEKPPKVWPRAKNVTVGRTDRGEERHPKLGANCPPMRDGRNVLMPSFRLHPSRRLEEEERGRGRDQRTTCLLLLLLRFRSYQPHDKRDVV